MSIAVGSSGFCRSGIKGLMLVAVTIGTLLAAANSGRPAERETARQILDAAGVTGGLVVHLGCGDGKLTAALHAGDGYLVHGLDTDAKNVERARKHIRSLGLYGNVSVEVWSEKRLPYADNLVNLLVSEDPGAAAVGEVLRVLVPDGVAYVKRADGWTKIVKPRPANIDEWTHYMHDASGNAVARDSVVGSPRHLQWVGEPRWARSHEHLATISAVVSAGGRVFTIVDEGPVASVDLPSNWFLVARDAFNGVVLWKRSIPTWEWRHRPFRSGAPQLPRRLVAVKDTVYVTLGYGKPLVALDALTGDVVRTYRQTDGAEEIVWHEGVLYVVVGDPEDQAASEAAIRRGLAQPLVEKQIMAFQAETGGLLWQKSDADTTEIMPLTLAAAGERLFFQTTGDVISLDGKSGKELWRAARPISLQRPGWSTPTLVVYHDVVLSADRQAPDEPAEGPRPRKITWSVNLGGGNAPPGNLIAFSAKTGAKLWSCKCREGYNSPVDVLVAGGLLWTGNLVHARDPGITVARDPATGEVKRERPNDQVFFTPGMSHHRCYRNRATERFLLLGRAGVEFIDVESGEATANHWIRGTCQFGVLPANGLLYAPSHTCACFIKTKLNGFNALAGGSRVPSPESRAGGRLERGPAFDQALDSGPSTLDSGGWPTYRHDPARSGATSTAVPTKLKSIWQTDLGGKLSSLTIAGGKAFVAEIDAHTVHALDAENGKTVWSFTAGGRVDSPPTFTQGAVLFGSADGWVYCLRAADGQLAWRFRAVPQQRRLVAYGQLESAWPVDGSVLVEDGVVSFAAGRSTFLDGGIRLCRLDAKTGALLWETRLSGRDPKTGEQPKSAIQGFDMAGVLPDVLSSDGEFIYMRHMKFDRQGVEQQEPGRHLFNPAGFLDDSWWHRAYFLFGEKYISGWGGWWRAGNQVPAGRLLVFDDAWIYGFGRNFYPSGNAGQWRTGEYYRVFATSKKYEIPKEPPTKKRRRKPRVAKSTVKCRWTHRADLEVRAMVLAGRTLFVAGPRGETQSSLDAFQGKQGISLRAVSTEDGSKLAEYKLDSLPVFDGLVAAGGRLYLSTTAGTVLSMGK